MGIEGNIFSHLPSSYFSLFWKNPTSHYRGGESQMLAFPVCLAARAWTLTLTKDDWGIESARTPLGNVFFPYTNTHTKTWEEELSCITLGRAVEVWSNHGHVRSMRINKAEDEGQHSEDGKVEILSAPGFCMRLWVILRCLWTTSH